MMSVSPRSVAPFMMPRIAECFELRVHDVTDTLSRVLGRVIEYEPASVPGYMLHLSRRGLPRSAILVQTVLHFLLRFGQGATTDPTLERILERPARTIHEYIEDHANFWERTSS